MFVGYRAVEIPTDAARAMARMAVLYPTDVPGREEAIGPFTLELALDAAPAAGPVPLAIISHGTGGSHLLYRALAHALARTGFVVGLLEHPGNNRADNHLAGTAAILAQRPQDVSAAIDWFAATPPFAGRVQTDDVAVIGHSLGGYTALAVAGGHPTSFPHEEPDQRPRPIAVQRDERVKAIVLLAPATVWFMAPNALRDVHVPILLFAGERDEATPPAVHARIVLGGVPDRAQVQNRVVANAGHYSFLSPYPPQMISPTFPPSQDPEGFDRSRFHEEMNAEIVAFLRRTLDTIEQAP